MIFEKIQQLVAEQFGMEASAITEQTSFVEDLNADSIDVVELMMAVEDEFAVGEIEETTLANLKTVGDIVNYIKEHTDC